MLHGHMELDCHFSLWNASYICCGTKGRGMGYSTAMKAGRISKRFSFGMEEDHPRRGRRNRCGAESICLK